MPSSDLTALLLKSYARRNRKQVLNAYRAAHALRLNRGQLWDYAVAENMTARKDPLGFYWLEAGPSGGGVPNISIEPDSNHDYGNVAVAGGVGDFNFVIRNTGTSGLTIGQCSITYNPQNFINLIDNASHATIAPGATRAITVRFDPESTGRKTGTLTIPNNSPRPSVYCSLAGTGT